MANLLERHEWDYVLGSVHFLGEFAVDFDDETDIWRHESTAERVWKRYFEALAESALTGHLRRHHPPGPGQDLGLRAARCPSKDPRFYYEPAIEAMLDAGVAMEVSTAGLRKPVGEIYPARGDARDGGRRGHPDRALQRRPPARAPRLRLRGRRSKLLERVRREARSPCSRSASGGWSRSGEDRARDRLAPLRRRAAADARRRRDPARPRARRPLRRRRARPRDHRRDPRRGRRWATSAPTSRTPTERWQRRGLDRAAARDRARASRPRAGASSTSTRP